MSKSSEEVLLIVGHVRHKKTDGTLYLMGERMAWMQGSKSSFSVSHMYADIKGELSLTETRYNLVSCHVHVHIYIQYLMFTLYVTPYMGPIWL